jgi:hypothetical protein
MKSLRENPNAGTTMLLESRLSRLMKAWELKLRYKEHAAITFGFVSGSGGG